MPRADVEGAVRYVKDGKIVLNASPHATQHLQLQNQWLSSMRVSAVWHHVRVPIAAVLGIYARETGEGMVFNDSDPQRCRPVNHARRR
jgi:stringent starvation protein B